MNKFNWIFWLLCASYMVGIYFDGYSLQPAHKALPIMVLLAISLITKGINRLLVGGALLFSAAGDVFLALPMEKSFEFGLMAFACAQITYFFYFIGRVHWQRWKTFPLTAVCAFFLTMSFVVLPASEDYFWYVFFYSGTLMLMTCGALLSVTKYKTQFYGALIFVVSDSLIAINKFVVTLPLEGYLIMTTYYVAQFLIIKGIIDTQREHATT